MEEQGKTNQKRYSYDAANRQVGIVSTKACGKTEKLLQTNRYDGKVIRFLFEWGELAQESREEEISYARNEVSFGLIPLSLLRGVSL